MKNARQRTRCVLTNYTMPPRLTDATNEVAVALRLVNLSTVSSATCLTKLFFDLRTHVLSSCIAVINTVPWSPVPRYPDACTIREGGSWMKTAEGVLPRTLDYFACVNFYIVVIMTSACRDLAARVTHHTCVTYSAKPSRCYYCRVDNLRLNSLLNERSRQRPPDDLLCLLLLSSRLPLENVPFGPRLI